MKVALAGAWRSVDDRLPASVKTASTNLSFAFPEPAMVLLLSRTVARLAAAMHFDASGVVSVSFWLSSVAVVVVVVLAGAVTVGVVVVGVDVVGVGVVGVVVGVVAVLVGDRTVIGRTGRARRA